MVLPGCAYISAPDREAFLDVDKDGVPWQLDCDDTNPSVSPSAVERCDPDDRDEDCDSLPDDLDPEGALDRSTLYVDADMDGYGDAADLGLYGCEARGGRVVNNLDCDDSDAGRNPATPWYADRDGDGDPDDLVRSCTEVPGRVSNLGDCDGADAGVYPRAPEFLDGIDADCDGVIDRCGSVTRRVPHSTE